MRKKRRSDKFKAFAIGLAVGYAAMLVVSVAEALVLSFFDGAAKTAGAAAVLSLSVGSYFCGRTTGKIRRRNGLKTGFLCGLLFSVLPIVLSIIFAEFEGAMLPVKLIMCALFGTIGGVAGVNSDEG